MSKLKDVAKLAGVSKSTVSRVINNGSSIAEETRRKVIEAMKVLDYNAQELKRSNEGTMMMGLILPFRRNQLYNSFGVEIMLGAEEKAFENNYMLLIGDSSGGETKESDLLAKMLNRDIEGLIILSQSGWKKENYALLENSGIPFVLVDQKIDNMTASIVRGDNLTSSIHLMNHLFSLGHRNIALISPTMHSTYLDRIRGYQISLMEREITVPKDYVMKLNELKINPYTAMKQLLLLDQRPTAVFISDPRSIQDCMKAIEEQQLRVPEDISLVVFDDSYVGLPNAYKDFFTSVNQSGSLMGSMAVEFLLQRIKKPETAAQEIILPGTFKISKSTGRVHEP